MGKWHETQEAYFGQTDSSEENTGRVLPILFNTEMVQAILDGRKTVTRRVMKPQPLYYTGRRYIFADECCPKKWEDCDNIIKTYQYQPDDILYVRETWRVGAWDIHNQMIAFDYKDGTCGELVHIQDRQLFERLVDQSREDARKARCEYNGVDFVWEKGKSPCRWHPSIHMPKEAARIWLKVTDIRVERLQDITEQQAEAEGLYIGWGPTPKSSTAVTARQAFMWLWDTTIKGDKGSWPFNPWVWVIEFERWEKPESCIIKGV